MGKKKFPTKNDIAKVLKYALGLRYRFTAANKDTPWALHGLREQCSHVLYNDNIETVRAEPPNKQRGGFRS